MARDTHSAGRLTLPALLMLSAVAHATPRLTCDAPEFDFGSVHGTQTVTHVFTIRNGGDEPLEMQPPHASCGCTAVQAGSLSLKPGETTTVQATIDLKGRSGPQHKTITILSNDPQAPRFTLGLTLDIWQEFRFLPPQLMLGQLRSDVSVQTSAMFENNSDRLISVTNVLCNNTNLEVRWQAETAGRRYRIAVSTLPPLMDGPMSAEILLQTSDTRQPSFILNFACHVRGLLVVTPPTIRLGVAETNMTSKSFVVSPGQEPSFHLVRIETPEPGMSATWQPYAVQGSYRVTVSNLSHRASLRGRSIKVVTDLTSMQTLVVPLDLEDAAP